MYMHSKCCRQANLFIVCDGVHNINLFCDLTHEWCLPTTHESDQWNTRHEFANLNIMKSMLRLHVVLYVVM